MLSPCIGPREALPGSDRRACIPSSARPRSHPDLAGDRSANPGRRAAPARHDPGPLRSLHREQLTLGYSPAPDGPLNTRLGPAIHAFNLPAQPDVCTGATPACSAACYAKGFLFRIQLARHRRNLEGSRDDRFARGMIGEIRRGLVRVVRVHTSGDFHRAG
jgi:hypothetical protein